MTGLGEFTLHPAEEKAVIFKKECPFSKCLVVKYNYNQIIWISSLYNENSVIVYPDES